MLPDILRIFTFIRRNSPERIFFVPRPEKNKTQWEKNLMNKVKFLLKDQKIYLILFENFYVLHSNHSHSHEKLTFSVCISNYYLYLNYLQGPFHNELSITSYDNIPII